MVLQTSDLELSRERMFFSVASLFYLCLNYYRAAPTVIQKSKYDIQT